MYPEHLLSLISHKRVHPSPRTTLSAEVKRLLFEPVKILNCQGPSAREDELIGVHAPAGNGMSEYSAFHLSP